MEDRLRNPIHPHPSATPTVESLEQDTPTRQCSVQPYRCELITDTAQLHGLRSEWNQLDSSTDSPLHSWEWLANWWECYRRPHFRLHIIAVREQVGDGLVAILPMYLHPQPLFGRVLRFLGTGEVCTDYNSLLVSASLGDVAIELVADELFDGAQTKVFDRIEFESVGDADCEIGKIVQSLSRRGLCCKRERATSSWRAALQSTWEEHLRTLSKSRRLRARKVKRDYLDAGRTTVQVANDEATFFEGYEVLVDLHQRRRQQLGERGCFASRRFRMFLRNAGLELMRAGKLQLQWLVLDGQPVSAGFDLIGREGVYHYQSGMEPTAEDHRPGWLGIICLMQRATGQGKQYFDFLRGDEAYKKSWGAREVRQENHVIVPARPIAQARAVVVELVRRLRRAIRAMLQKSTRQ